MQKFLPSKMQKKQNFCISLVLDYVVSIRGASEEPVMPDVSTVILFCLLAVAGELMHTQQLFLKGATKEAK